MINVNFLTKFIKLGNNMDLIKEEHRNLNMKELYQSVNKDKPTTQSHWEYHKILENRDML